MKSTMEPGDKDWLVYILQCSDRTLYTGATNNIGKRLIAHNKGTASRYTRTRLPVKLLAVSRRLSCAAALRLEMKIKKRPKSAKLKTLAEDGSGGNQGNDKERNCPHGH
ncbi:MAG TPA: GIY-YIG nuclease family protein [Smithellaceae bacterium]|nr:GIY-YIG nuclease family protein [Smithellaceae bacterium]